MNISDEIRKLQDLHRSGALTDEEFTAAKAAVFTKRAAEDQWTTDPALLSHLEEIRLQNEIARLDREWELGRERYMIAGKHGHRYVPSRGMSVLAGVVIVGFGIVWTVVAASIGVFDWFPLFGVFFILLGIGMSINLFSKAGKYEQAYQKYRRRRSLLLMEQNDRQRTK